VHREASAVRSSFWAQPVVRGSAGRIAGQQVKEVAVAAVRWIHYAYLAHLSRPKAVRKLYRLVKRLRICRIVEIGVSDVQRTVRLIRTAQRFAGDKGVTYAGLDWFDARPDGQPPLALKDAYRMLHQTKASVRLVPGEPAVSLSAVANWLPHTGLLLISPTVADDSLASSWLFVPRMLDDRSVVLREHLSVDAEPAFTRLSAAELAQYAGQTPASRAA
jgi:hypothetical protein